MQTTNGPGKDLKEILVGVGFPQSKLSSELRAIKLEWHSTENRWRMGGLIMSLLTEPSILKEDRIAATAKCIEFIKKTLELERWVNLTDFFQEHQVKYLLYESKSPFEKNLGLSLCANKAFVCFLYPQMLEYPLANSESAAHLLNAFNYLKVYRVGNNVETQDVWGTLKKVPALENASLQQQETVAIQFKEIAETSFMNHINATFGPNPKNGSGGRSGALTVSNLRQLSSTMQFVTAYVIGGYLFPHEKRKEFEAKYGSGNTSDLSAFVSSVPGAMALVKTTYENSAKK